VINHRQENNPSHQAGEEELRILNKQLREQADQLRALNQDLVDREARLRLSIETGRIGIWVWDATGSVHVPDWSRRLKEIFGSTDTIRRLSPPWNWQGNEYIPMTCIFSTNGELTIQSAPENGTAILVVLPLMKYPPPVQL
jgi:PAS domain-containing protein